MKESSTSKVRAEEIGALGQSVCVWDSSSSADRAQALVQPYHLVTFCGRILLCTFFMAKSEDW